jgi:hypothetical protein
MGRTLYMVLTTMLTFALVGVNSRISAGRQVSPIVHGQVGADNNFRGNPFVQPQDPALAGGGIDQTLKFGDVLFGTRQGDFLIGGLGDDVLFGRDGDDVLLGGLEHFHPRSRDRIFGHGGDDIVIWAPGDGSDFMDGGPGQDVLILGLVGEVVEGQVVFRLSEDKQAGEVFIDPKTNLPLLEVSNAPGFCQVIEQSSSADAGEQLAALGVQHLVRFCLRDVAKAFARGDQQTDNGLRQTMHLQDMEVLLCASRDGGAIEVLDLTVSPPASVPLTSLALRHRLEQMIR